MSDRCPGSPGDIVVFPRTLYNHYAVNVGDNDIVHVTSIWDNPGSLDVAGICCSTSERLAQVKKEKFSDFKKTNDNPYVETNWKNKKPLPNSKVVERAVYKVGHKGYSVLLENCEHFAHWCRYDEAGSDQADGIITGAKYAAGGATMAAGAVGAAYAISRLADQQPLTHLQVDQRVLSKLEHKEYSGPFENWGHLSDRFRYDEAGSNQGSSLIASVVGAVLRAAGSAAYAALSRSSDQPSLRRGPRR